MFNGRTAPTRAAHYTSLDSPQDAAGPQPAHPAPQQADPERQTGRGGCFHAFVRGLTWMAAGLAHPFQWPRHQQDAQGAHGSRPKPMLANRSSLCTESKRMANNEALREELSSVLQVTYSRNAAPLASNLANNLLLDLNLHAEERLQHSLEHMPGAVPNIKRMVELIHGKVMADALPEGWQQMSGQALLDKRLELVAARLKPAFEKAGALPQLQEYMSKRSGTDRATQALRQGLEKVLGADAMADVKLLKMLFSQLPYFGGSVQYRLNEQPELEFWIYHLSTLTRDSSRLLKDAPEMPKPIHDYITAEDSKLPVNNQRNLGTGVTEATWQELPNEIKRKLLKDLVRRLDDSNEGQVGARFDRNKKRYADLLAEAEVIPGERLGEKIMELWDKLDEDKKKEVFGDIAAIPWSSAHLHAPGTYESELRISELGEEHHSWVARHPDTKGKPGLQNVAGVFGNVLEVPETAAEKYMAELSKKIAEGAQTVMMTRPQEHESGGFLELDQRPYALDELKTEFIEKHGAWHDKAMKHNKPIIGGMSGHTLGYLSLYRDALSQSDAPQNEPSLEYLRALMLAGLVGQKRHHSYDEVMTASVGIGVGEHKLGYRSEASYQDLLQSDEPEIRQAAEQAFEGITEDFTRQGNRSVLDTMCNSTTLNARQQKAFRAEMEPLVGRYHATLAASDSAAGALDGIRTAMERVIGKHLPHAAEGHGPQLQSAWNLPQRSAAS